MTGLVKPRLATGAELRGEDVEPRRVPFTSTSRPARNLRPGDGVVRLAAERTVAAVVVDGWATVVRYTNGDSETYAPNVAVLCRRPR